MFRATLFQKENFSQACFWQGTVGETDLVDNHSELIMRISQGNTAGQMERQLVNSHYIYFFRINKADRFVFSTIEFNACHYLIPLEIIKNHDYQKSRFLQPGVFQAYIDIHIDALLEQINQLHQTNDSSPSPPKKIIIPRVVYDHDKWISLDETQSKILSIIYYPAIISGLAGTGKTTLALNLLVDYIQTKAAPGERILFITRSPYLLRDIKAHFEKMNIQRNDIEVVFSTYDELNPAPETKVGRAEALDWIKNHFLRALKNQRKTAATKGKGKGKTKKKSKNNTQNDPMITLLESSIDKFYEAWRSMSVRTLDESIELTNEEKCFSDPEAQKIVEKALQEYLKELKAKQLCDTALCKMDTTGIKPFDFTVVDESPDFDNLELTQIATLTKDLQICYFMDVNQDIYDNHSKRPFLIRQLGKTGRTVFSEYLPSIHRSAENIALFGKKFLDLSDTVGAGTVDQYSLETNSIVIDSNKQKGIAKWHADWCAETIEQMKEKLKYTEFAVVTEEGDKDEAKKLFETKLVFTPEEIKGLGFSVIACYRLLDITEFKAVNRLLESIPKEEYGKRINRPKANRGNQDFRRYFHRVFTSVMRGVSEVHFFQKKHYHLKNIHDYLDPAEPSISQNEQLIIEVVSQPAPVTTKEDYQALVKQLIAHENISLAKEIYLEQKLGTEDAFNALLPQKSVKKSAAKPQPSEATPSPSQATSAPINREKLVEDLCKNFTSKKIDWLFNHEDSMTLMFQTPLRSKQGICLFGQILSDHDHRKLFFNYFEKKKNGKSNIDIFIERVGRLFAGDDKFPDHEEGLYNLFFWLTMGREPQALLAGVINKYPDAMKNIPTHFLTRREDVTQSNALEVLSLADIGRFILYSLININPEIITAFTDDSLCRGILDEGVRYTLLYGLSSKHDYKILNTLFDLNPALLAQISLNQLSLPVHSLSDPSSPLTSVLHFWNQSEGGRRLIKEWLNVHPDDREKALKIISPEKPQPTSTPTKDLSPEQTRVNYIENLYKNFTDDNLDRLANSKLLFHFLFNQKIPSIGAPNLIAAIENSERGPRYLDIFNKWASNNRTLQSKTLYNIASVITIGPRSLFMHFVSYRSTAFHLNTFLQKKPLPLIESPEFIKECINFTDLTSIQKYSNGDVDSPLLYMSQYTVLRKMLSCFFQTVPNERINSNCLFGVQKLSNGYIESPLIYLLHKIEFIYDMLKDNHDWMMEITPECLFGTLGCLSNGGKLDTTSPFYWLAKYPKLLLSLFETNEKLVQAITLDCLFRPRFVSEPGQLNKYYPAYFLAKGEDNLALLTYIFDKKSDLIDLHSDYFCFESITPFVYQLSMTESGCKLLQKFLKHHTFIEHKMQPCLFSRIEEEGSAFDRLLETSWGTEFIIALFEQYPKIIDKVPVEYLDKISALKKESKLSSPNSTLISHSVFAPANNDTVPDEQERILNMSND